MTDHSQDFKDKSKSLIVRILDSLHDQVDTSYPNPNDIMCLIDEKLESNNFDLNDKEYLKISANDSERFLRILLSFIVNPSNKDVQNMRSKISEFKNVSHKHMFSLKSSNESKDSYIFGENTVDEMLSLYSGRYPNVISKEYSPVNCNVDSKIRLYLSAEEIKHEIRRNSLSGSELINILRKPLGRDHTCNSNIYIKLSDILSYLYNVEKWAYDRSLSSFFNQYELYKMFILLSSTSSTSTNLYTDISGDCRHPEKIELINKYVSLDTLLYLVSDLEESFIHVNMLARKIMELPCEVYDHETLKDMVELEKLFNEHNYNKIHLVKIVLVLVDNLFYMQI